MHGQSSQKTMAIPGTSELRKEPEAGSSNGNGHGAVSVVSQCALHLGNAEPIGPLSRDMPEMVQLGTWQGFPRPPKGQISESGIYTICIIICYSSAQVSLNVISGSQNGLVLRQPAKGAKFSVTDAADSSKLLLPSVCSPAMPTEYQTYR